MAREHSLYSQDLEMTIEFFDKFDGNKIIQSIINHLEKNPKDILEHCREYSKSDVKKYYGNEIINFYGVNPKNNKVSLIITKGNKEYFKSLK